MDLWGRQAWVGCYGGTLGWSGLAQRMPKAWTQMGVDTRGGCVHSKVADAGGALLGVIVAAQVLPDLPAPKTYRQVCVQAFVECVLRCIQRKACNATLDQKICCESMRIMRSLAKPLQCIELNRVPAA